MPTGNMLALIAFVVITALVFQAWRNRYPRQTPPPNQPVGGAQTQGAAAGNAGAPNNPPPAPAGNQGAAAQPAAAAPTRRQRAFAWMRSHWLLEVIILGLIGLGGALLYFYLPPNSTTFEGIGFGERTSSWPSWLSLTTLREYGAFLALVVVLTILFWFAKWTRKWILIAAGIIMAITALLGTELSLSVGTSLRDRTQDRVANLIGIARPTNQTQPETVHLNPHSPNRSDRVGSGILHPTEGLVVKIEYGDDSCDAASFSQAEEGALMTRLLVTRQRLYEMVRVSRGEINLNILIQNRYRASGQLQTELERRRQAGEPLPVLYVAIGFQQNNSCNHLSAMVRR